MAYRPTEKTEARRVSQINSLLKAAVAIVAEGGFSQLTIAAVSSKAGVATGTVYKYFESKAQLCTAVFRLATEKEVAKVREVAFPAAMEGASCQQRLINGIRVFAERALKSDHLAYALIAEPVGPMIEAERLIYRQAYADIYAELITEGVDKKEFPGQLVNVSSTAVVGVIAETLIAPLGRKSEGNSAGIDALEQEELLQAIQHFCVRAITGAID